MAKFKVVKGQLEEVEEQAPTMSAHEAHEQIVQRYAPLAVADEWVPFPQVDCPVVPVGPSVVVQKRTARKKVGSIHTSAETQDVDSYSERVGKLVAVSAGAFRTVEGAPAFGVLPQEWPKVGDLVRIPDHGGDNFFRTSADGKTKVKLTVFHWRDLLAVVKDADL